MKTQEILWGFVLTLFVFGSFLLNVCGDFFWFETTRYIDVFLTVLFTKILTGVIFALLFVLFVWINVVTAKNRLFKKRERERFDAEKWWFLGLVIILGILAGLWFSDWNTVLKYLNPAGFGVSDPVFNKDVSFYVFTLPFYCLVLGFVAYTLVMTIFLVGIFYFVYSKPRRIEYYDYERHLFDFKNIKNKMFPHLSWLLMLLFVVIGVGFWFARYELLFSSTGVTYGAGYTDVNVLLPLFTFLSVFSFIISGLCFVTLRKRNERLLVKILLIFFIVLLVGLGFAGVTQAFVVKPDEFNMERIYIERNIQNTLSAYNLDKIEGKQFQVDYNLTFKDIQKNNRTINNIRIWDWRPLKETYKQLQLFRTYYDFLDVDIDRYEIGNEYKQVMVSGREINTENLPSNAKTWVNEHLVYTHGYGIVMNPVDKVSEEGQPVFYIKDIPPSKDYFVIKRPEIYYGEKPSEYVVVRTSTKEFDYPSGEDNIYSIYNGSGGVLLDPVKRFVYALKLGDIELLVSSSIKPESKILMYTNIKERVKKICPFLMYDSDPYIVVSDGKLYWIIDAYTVTDRFPYSEPVYIRGYGVINYIRNSVKVVIDAYNGDVKYYVIDDSDPLIRTYRKIFPALFKDFSEMPEHLKLHIRYPEDLFIVQAEIYSTYHMRDPRVFYNKEDVWVMPEEIYSGGKQKMLPYFIIMKLPDSEKEEFILMIPFTPKGKDNLIGWMAGRCDTPEYGKLMVYQFSKQKLVYGPMQIEARIDQNTEISKVFTLWSQAGSGIIRGNILVIPVENSIIYVEPVYLKATEKGTLPELKRVILAYGNRIVMKKTLGDALKEMFGGEREAEERKTKETAEEKLKRIADLYHNAMLALKQGNLSLYAGYIEEIGEVV
ncbi:MAG: UPF0182 family protein [Candidatus Aenigmatarchaeota archaeon]|nr:MAG: UPF0182 family protein [Candidatus Aenigmarchaeota archaeon]